MDNITSRKFSGIFNVRQGSILFLFIFSLVINRIMFSALEDSGHEIALDDPDVVNHGFADAFNLLRVNKFDAKILLNRLTTEAAKTIMKSI